MPPKGKTKEEVANEELLKRQAAAFNEALGHMGTKVYPNMDNLPVLTEEYVLANLHNLYHKDQPTNAAIPHNYSTIYSQVGPILIALNPFKSLNCYDKSWQEAFHELGQAGQTEVAWRTLGPHCFNTIETAYQALKRTRRNQAIVICGESGAGKTWTCKLMLDYLLDNAVAKSSDQDGGAAAKAKLGDEAARKETLMNCNVVLEAFGNAKTQRNDNSSRFGKFSQIFFDDKYAVQGLNFDHYLLERSRIVCVPDNERTYHILHYLAKEEEKANHTTFDFLSAATNVQRASEVEVNGRKSRAFDDVADFAQLKADMAKAAFPMDVQLVLYDIFKGCMYLGNVAFEGEDEGKPAAGSLKDYKTAMTFLGLTDQDGLTYALSHKEIKVGNEIVKSPVSGTGSMTQRDNLVKAVYSRLFDWIIAQMNKAMAGLEAQYDSVGTCGLLDIFGFEDLMPNGFEQMFINLTNERIQHHFNNIMFDNEMKLYAEEGIQVEFDRPDNSPAILLFTAPKNSIVSHLTELVRGKKDLDGEKFRATLDQACSVEKNKDVYVQIDMMSPTDPRDGFRVNHYAGIILYRCQNFVEKSKDACAMCLIEQFGKSTAKFPANPITKQSDAVSVSKALFPEELQKLAVGDRDSSQSATVGSTFTQQLASLMNNKLGAYHPVFGQRPPDQDPLVDSVFVRCIKPRANSLAKFDAAMVRSQLVTGGVMAALKIRELGMPDRMDYDEFLKEFWVLEKSGKTDSGVSLPQRCKAILGLFYEELTPKGDARYKCGKTKVFMKSGIVISLREIVDIVTFRCAKVVKRKWRAKTGLDMLSDLDQMKSRIDSLQVEAESYGVAKVSTVTQGIATCRAEMNQAFQVLGQDPEKFEITRKALKKRKEGVALRRQSEVAISERIGYGGAFSKNDMLKLSQKVEDARDQVIEVVNNRKAATDKVDALLVQRYQQIEVLVERINEVMKYCKDSDPPERGGNLWRSCMSDKENLGRIANEEFKKLAKEAVEAVDLNKKERDQLIHLPPKVEELVFEAEALVSKTEKGGAELIVQRKHFAFEQLRSSPQLQALQQEREHAKERIDIIGHDLDQARKHGLTKVTDILNKAMSAEREIEETLREALNGDRYAKAIEAYLETEKELQETVAEMKKLEAEKVEREKRSRRKIFDGFDKSKELLQVYFAFQSHIEMFKEHLKETSQKVEVESTTSTSINALMDKIHNALDSMDEMQVESMIESQAGEKIRFNYKGDWSPECFKLLGPDLEPFKGLAQCLSEERCTDVVDAVELLNSGLMTIEEGYCIAWSKTWKQYYLLFQKAKEEQTITMLNRRRLEIETEDRAKKRRAVQEAVQGALKALSPEELKAHINRDQAALENKIKDHMRGELEGNFVERARKEVEYKTEQVKKEVRAQIDAVEASLQKAMEQKAAAESGYQARINELTAELERCQVQTGVKGLVPSLHKQLTQVNTYCQGLQKSILQLKELASKEMEGIEEALAYMDALTNNPKTLPGLRDFVKVLGSLQVNHTHSESICHQLGLEGQLSALNEARDQMAEAAAKVKRICEGQVKHDSGLEAELKLLKTDLRICSKSFDMLKRVFQTWETRLSQASDCIDKALDCIDTKLEKVPHLKDTPRSPKRGSMWDRVMNGVMDNLCTANRPQDKASSLQAAKVANLRIMGTSAASAAKRPDVPQQPTLHAEYRPWREQGHLPRRPKFQIGIGDFVQDTANTRHRGIVRFVGPTEFATGEWVGIELEGPHGKNNGSVNGKRYFECPPEHGIFLRSNALVKIGGQGHRELTSDPDNPPGASSRLR